MWAPLSSSGNLGDALLPALYTVLALVGLGALAFRLLSGRGLSASRRGRHVQVLERLPLDMKSALVVVRSGERTWLLATGEGAAPRLLTELHLPPASSQDDG